jgi:hypothetical protein
MVKKAVPVRFDERNVETKQGEAGEAPADERVGNGYAPPTPPRHISTLPHLDQKRYHSVSNRTTVNVRMIPFWQGFNAYRVIRSDTLKGAGSTTFNHRVPGSSPGTAHKNISMKRLFWRGHLLVGQSCQFSLRSGRICFSFFHLSRSCDGAGRTTHTGLLPLKAPTIRPQVVVRRAHCHQTFAFRAWHGQ